MKKTAMMRIAAIFTTILLPLSTHAGGISEFKVSSFYVNGTGTVVAAWAATGYTMTNPASCANFANNLVLFVCGAPLLLSV